MCLRNLGGGYGVRLRKIYSSYCGVEKGSKEGVVRAIELNEELVGSIGAHTQANEYARTAAIGYWVGKQYWARLAVY